MASRILRPSLLINNLKNQKIKIQKRFSHDDHHVSRYDVYTIQKITADALPQASGSWKELNDKRQSINNATLALGIGLFVSSLIGTYALGFWNNVYFSAPKSKISKDFPGAKFVN